MERLTIQYDGEWVPKGICSIDRYGEADDCGICSDFCGDECSDCPVQKCFDQLAAYEDTGLTPEDILKLHDTCGIEIGDTVFILTKYVSCQKPKIIEAKVIRKTVKTRKTFSVEGYYQNGSYYKGTFVDKSIGRTVFLSREEAEYKLSR